MDKPGSWFLLAKCSKNTCGRETFQVNMKVIDQLPGFYIGETLVENGLNTPNQVSVRQITLKVNLHS